MTSYADLPEAEQVALLQAVAAEALPAFGLEGAVITPVLHAYNSTYRVDRDGASWALRILVGSKATPANIAAQQAWQRALASEANVVVPVPLPTLDGAWWTGVASDGFGRTAIVTVAGWLDGTAIDDALDVPTARLLGAAMARMHVHAADWAVPVGASLPVFDDVLFGDHDALADVDDLDAPSRVVLDEARARSQALLTRLHGLGGVRPLHADLHSGNLLRSADGLQLLDFDDAGLGVPALDLAIARISADEPQIHAALADGYASVAPLPDASEPDLHALAAGRQLLLANDLLSSTTASLRADARTYVDTAVRRLAAWLDAGTFTRRVD
ncbi:phosphotransferase enzyme family protein [Agrococcus jejuensis]|uniref:Ser/Thr protein kinase RdoA involved in Cpx stress response, MazF antagonist n=1 Tax=Agrococcus jejuensis TaxID=399736 RepID=A0A1G8H6T2_9MICO|nr:phosphotransferase [Agrococcus jejuensis]SDI02342.1 Ser/Thr protein kinase RdoA involved in Cpx stress response, MazF antagonist [Agrococcus jejuensis]